MGQTVTTLRKVLYEVVTRTQAISSCEALTLCFDTVLATGIGGPLRRVLLIQVYLVYFVNISRNFVRL
jgi:hypothetical protein